MSKTDFKPRRLDVAAFAEAGARLEGRIGLDELPRLAEQLHRPTAPAAAPANPTVHWQAKGELQRRVGAADTVWLHLQATTEVPLECQRCLDTVAEPLQVDRPFRFVADETSAAEADADADEDVLALSRNFDLIALIEDELLLALPLVPRHETCPQPLPLAEAADPPEDDEPAAPHPFASLAILKKPGH